MDRRKLLKVAGAGLITGLTTSKAISRQPIARSGPTRFQISLAAYSLREYFAFSKGEPQKPAHGGKAISMTDFLDYCVSHGFDAAELTSYFFNPEADLKYFQDLKHAAFVRGINISGTAIGNNFTCEPGKRLDQEIESSLRWIEFASYLGAPHIRFFAGKGEELKSHPERMDQAVKAMMTCAKVAASKGIFIGIENHGNLSSDQMLEIMERVPDDDAGKWVGINLDTGNFISDDPYDDIKRCVPFAVNVQLKTSMRSPAGTEYPADISKIVSILNQGGYQGTIAIEYEDEQPYAKIPTALGRLRTAINSLSD